MNKQFSNSYALLIGVDKSNAPEFIVPGIKKNIKVLKQTLTDRNRCLCPVDNFEILTGTKATGENIFKALDRLRGRIQQGCRQDPTIFVYFSGYVRLDETYGIDRYCLLPYDQRQPIQARLFAKELSELKPARLLVIFDCYSSARDVKTTVPTDLFIENDKAIPLLVRSDTTARLQVEREFGRVILSSTRDLKSFDKFEDGFQSNFTNHLVGALSGNTVQLLDETERLGWEIVIQFLKNSDDSTLNELLSKVQSFTEQRKQDMNVSNHLAYSATMIETGGGSVVQGNVHANGDFISGNKLFVENMYTGSPIDDPAEALKIYCYALITASQYLSLHGIDLKADSPLEESLSLDLATLYVALDTTTKAQPEEDKSPPLSVLDAVILKRKLVLLGGPGSGKSTFLKYLALCLAWHALEPQTGWLRQLPNWPEENLIPLPVVLRDFARQKQPEKPDEPRHLWEFIVEQLKKQNLGFVEKALLHQVSRGNVLLLLDGLDEVPRQDATNWVVRAVQAFINQHGNCRLIVTCRTFTYLDTDWKLEGVDALTIADFDEQKIEQFITAWYKELQRSKHLNKQDALRLHELLLKAAQRKDLRRLATNPLLLTVMAQINTFRGRLPDSRILLYKEAIELLLLRWDDIRNIKPLRVLLAEVKRNHLDLERIFWRLAYDAHSKAQNASSDYLPDISEAELLSALATLHPRQRRPWASEFLELIRLRAGLLFERMPGVYTFAHRTFQEYLAGSQLAADHSTDIARKIREVSTERTLWREVILMAIGRLVQVFGDLASPLTAAEELYPEEKPRSREEWLQVWLAGEILEKMGIHRAMELAQGRRLQKSVNKRLVDLLQQDFLTPLERASVGRTLGNIGDPRSGVGVQTSNRSADTDDQLPDILWCGVPAGAFQMGGDPLVARNHWQGTTINIAYAYYISKYPITYAQFAEFVESKAYQNRKYWTEAGWRWRLSRGEFAQPSYWDDPQWNVPNHPVVGLSWFECYAYSQWLTEKLGYVVRLPTEAEWEKAARYSDGRFFPWGNEPLSGAANLDETYERRSYLTGEIDKNVKIGTSFVGSTTAVGLYDGYTSILGICDLSGNIWEWLLSGQYSHLNAQYIHHLPEEIDVEGDCRREMRGGSWKNDIARARLAYRASNPPISQDNTDGFRLVRDDRYSPEEWKRIQATTPKRQSVEDGREATNKVRLRGKVIHMEQGKGTIETREGKTFMFALNADVVGSSLFCSLHPNDSVTFEVDELNKTSAKFVKRLFTGTVKKWDAVVAFGFVGFRLEEDRSTNPALMVQRSNEMELYMHQNDIVSVDDWMQMKPGEQVEFEIDDTFLYGETTQEARNIRLVGQNLYD